MMNETLWKMPGARTALVGLLGVCLACAAFARGELTPSLDDSRGPMRGARPIAADGVPRPKLITHLDFNTAHLSREAVLSRLRVAAAAGFDAVLWEVEDKVRWESADVAKPGAFTKAEFREILAEAEKLGLEPVPLMQTFGHAEYVLTHPKYAGLREKADAINCYCVSKPETRAFLKALLHEYLGLFGPKVKWFHLGGDEANLFGTCPVCSKRVPMELYSEHLMDVSSELREKGIRPGIWCDMILNKKHAADLAKIPRELVIWHWDYQVGAAKTEWTFPWTKMLPQVRDLGFDVVFSGSASSYGDSPFLPEMRIHRENLGYGADLVRKERLAGLCVTSWSVRQNLKCLQEPLVRFTGKRLRAPGATAEADWADALRTSGVTMGAADFDAFTAWTPRICAYDGRDWHWLKDSAPPAPGELLRVLKRDGPPNAAVVSNLLAGVRRTLPLATGDWKEAGGLQLKLLERYAALSRGEMPTSVPLDETARHYGREQTPASAANSANIVWGMR